MSAAGKTVVVVGGGMAGASAALDLAQAGVRVELIEQSPFIGGHAANITCKALDECQQCNGCLVDPKLEALLEHPLISIRRNTRLTGAEAKGKGYKLELATAPSHLDPAVCTNCGLCLDECPQPGAIWAAPYAGDRVKLAIDPANCLYFQDQKSTLCRDVCPVEAIDFGLKPSSAELDADALILATGFIPYDPSAKSRLSYGRLPNVITAMELEKTLRQGHGANRPHDGQPAERVAFIQCVGSREREGHNYCSRVCCAYALRLGRALHKNQDADVSVFHMDLQSFGEDFDAYLETARKEINLVRAMPYDVLPGEGGRAELVFQPASGQGNMAESFDLVVLSQAMTPGGASPELFKSLGVGLDEHGFITDGNGVFTAGAATGPMDLREVIASAGRACQSALSYLEAD